MTRRNYEQVQIDGVLSTIQRDIDQCPIEAIHTNALHKYQQEKKRKKNELSIQRAASNIPITKQQKKRDVNHASAVASRTKHGYLLGQFETTLRRKISEGQVLSDAINELRDKVCERDRLLAAKDNEIANLHNQIAIYQSRSQSNASQLPDAQVQLTRQYHIPFDVAPTCISKDNQSTTNPNIASSTSTTTTRALRPPTLSTSPIHDLGVAMDEIISPVSPPTFESMNKEQHQQHAANSLVFQWTSRMGEDMTKSNNVNPAA